MITSTANPLVKRVKSLRRRRSRESEGAFFAEGIAVTIEALDSSSELERLILAPALLTSETGRSAVERARAEGVAVTEVSGDVFSSISARDDPAGLAAVIRARRADLGDMALGVDSTVIVLDRCGDPGNLGTILRTADATSCAAVVLCGPSTDASSPESVRASMGAVFRVPVARVDGVEGVAAYLQDRGLALVSTSARAGTSLWEADLPPGAAYLFGSEKYGLAPEVRAVADLDVSLPMQGAASSLNLAVAAGIVMYEVVRRRRSV